MVKESPNNNNIVIWPSSFYPVIGGVQTVAKEIGGFIQNKNWNVTFITNRYPRKLDSKDTIDSMKIYRFTFLHSPFNYLKSFRFDLVLGWIFYKPITCIKLISLFSKIRPKVVHIHFPDNQIFEILILKKVFGFKLIISFHGNDIEQIQSISKNNLKHKLFQKLIDESSFVTSCSDFLKNQILDIFPLSDNKKIETMYNGVSDIFMNKLLSKEKNQYFFSVGRFVHKKGFDILANVSKIFPETEFQLGGGNKADFLHLVPRYNEQFNFLGQLTTFECFNKFSKAKITIVPSRKEPYGIVIAEALCCGSPIIATNVGGIPEVIELAKSSLTKDEITIFNHWVKLVEPNVKSLDKGIKDILENISPINDYIQIIPKIKKQFTWEKRLEKYFNSLSVLIQ